VEAFNGQPYGHQSQHVKAIFIAASVVTAGETAASINLELPE
jgi:hypothetical protein